MKKYLLILTMLLVISMAAVSISDSEKGKPVDDKISKNEWVDKLIQKLKSNDLWVRVEAIKKLGDLKESRSVWALKEALSDESIDINVEALRALKKIGDKDAVDLILCGTILYDLQSLRFYAVSAAAALDLDKTRDYLAHYLVNPSADIRANAAESIANLFTITGERNKKAISDMITALAYENRETEKKKIAEALNTVTKANLDTPDENEWKKWWQANKDTLKEKVEAPMKVVITGSQMEKPKPKEAEEREKAEKKFEDFKDKAILDKKPSDKSSSYYLARSEQGKKAAIEAYGEKDRDVLKSVENALNWLMRHQNKQTGAWEYSGYVKNCPADKRDDITEINYDKQSDLTEIKKDYDVAVTGLALLAFLGAGHTHIPGQKVGLYPGGEYKPTVERGLRWLISIQKPDGSFQNPKRQYQKVNMFEQAMATLAISEAYGMTGDAELRSAAEFGMAFINRAKNPGKGWRYTPLCGDNDTSLVGWQIFALKSGKVSGLNIQRNDLSDASAWLDEMTNTESGRVGYAKKGQGSTTMTSIGIICRMLLGWRNDSPLLKKGAEIVIADKSYLGKSSDFYHIYQSTLAMFQMGDPYWKNWNSTMTDYLDETQVKKGCEHGSWSALNDRWCKSRVYSTALGALSLEVYYRYLPFARLATPEGGGM